MNVQISTRSKGRSHTAVLVADRLECLALPCGGRSAGIHRARPPEERFEQRRPIVATLRGQVARHSQSDHAGQKPEGIDGGWLDRSDEGRGLCPRRSAVAHAVPAHRPRGLLDADQARRGKQGYQRMEDCHDAGDGECSDQTGRAAGGGRGRGERHPPKIKKPTPILGVNHFKKWSGRAENHSSDWSMDRRTTPKNGEGGKRQALWKANAGAGFGLKGQFFRFENHTPRIGLLYMLPGYGGLSPSFHALSHAWGGWHARA